MYEVFKMLHALKLNVLLNYQNSKLCKNKTNSSQEGIQLGKMCTTNLQPFRPIPISVQTNSYFRPNPISGQFLFPTNSYFRPIPISDHADCEVGTFSRKHGKRTAACGNYK